ncbi:MAG: hypothetical protein H6737_07780 [Alphaproteobacteria bacterium]|nr:hypothetical protein [Alphaproteobacteria bacterium]
MIALLLFACRPEPTCDPAWVPPEAASFVAVLSDFTVGEVAFGSSLGEVGESVLAVSGDTLVRPVDGVVYVVERGTVDAVTAIDRADPGVPLWQTALPQGANAHDLVGFDGRLWVPCQGTPEVLVLDPADGAVLSRIDLASLGEGDGNPDLDAAVVVAGRLFVAAQQLHDDPEVPGILFESDGGLLVELDAAGGVAATFPVGPNPRIEALGDHEIAVMTGLFQFPGASESRVDDDRLQVFDVVTGVLGPVRYAGDGEDFFAAASAGDHLVLLTVDSSASSRVHCLDMRSDGQGEFRFPTGWAYTASRLLDDRVVVGDRAQPDAPLGASTFTIDPASCEPLRGGPSCTTLDPYDLAAL